MRFWDLQHCSKADTCVLVSGRGPAAGRWADGAVSLPLVGTEPEQVMWTGRLTPPAPLWPMCGWWGGARVGEGRVGPQVGQGR